MRRDEDKSRYVDEESKASAKGKITATEIYL
jgi:hypothetical protein